MRRCRHLAVAPISSCHRPMVNEFLHHGVISRPRRNIDVPRIETRTEKIGGTRGGNSPGRLFKLPSGELHHAVGRPIEQEAESDERRRRTPRGRRSTPTHSRGRRDGARLLDGGRCTGVHRPQLPVHKFNGIALRRFPLTSRFPFYDANFPPA